MLSMENGVGYAHVTIFNKQCIEIAVMYAHNKFNNRECEQKRNETSQKTETTTTTTKNDHCSGKFDNNNNIVNDTIPCSIVFSLS